MDENRKKAVMKAFGLHLKQIREKKGISLRVLEQFSDVDHSQIHRIEKGDSAPSVVTLVALAEALGTNLKELVDFNGES